MSFPIVSGMSSLLYLFVFIDSDILAVVALDFCATQKFGISIGAMWFFKAMRTSYRINNGARLTRRNDIFVEKCMNNG